jgi:hypothetical protein
LLSGDESDKGQNNRKISGKRNGSSDPNPKNDITQKDEWTFFAQIVKAFIFFHKKLAKSPNSRKMELNLKWSRNEFYNQFFQEDHRKR